MASSDQLRSWWAPYRCNTSKMVRVSFPGVGRSWDLLVAAEARPAWLAFAAVMASEGYLFRESAGGTYNCRPIDGSTKYSLHAYGIAIDLNPSKNPYGKPLRTDIPQAFRERVGTIVANGTRCFEWGGAWTTPDAMHFEIDVSPADIAKGVTFDQGDNDDMELLIKVYKGQTTAFYAEMQKRVNVPAAPGNPGYWGSDGPGPKASDQEWIDNIDKFVGATVQMAAWPPAGGAPPDLSGYSKVGHEHDVTGKAK